MSAMPFIVKLRREDIRREKRRRDSDAQGPGPVRA
jgi:hypothetical protein